MELIMKIDTNNLRVNFGKYKNELWTRVPLDYLRWLVNEPDNIKGMEMNKVYAQAELDRRGTHVNREVEITPHAVDRASIKLLHQWRLTRLKDGNNKEGIYTWLSRMANEAGKDTKNEVVYYSNIKFVFRLGNLYPILKTVMPIKSLKKKDDGAKMGLQKESL